MSDCLTLRILNDTILEGKTPLIIKRKPKHGGKVYLYSTIDKGLNK